MGQKTFNFLMDQEASTFISANLLWVRLGDRRLEVSFESDNEIIVPIEAHIVSYNSIRPIPIMGQKSRILKLVSILKGADGDPFQLAKSIADFNMAEQEIHFFVPAKNGRNLKFVGQKTMFRQSGYLTQNEKVCQIMIPQEGVVEAINNESVSYDSLMESFRPMSMGKKDWLIGIKVIPILSNMYNKEFFYLGGSPDKGLCVVTHNNKIIKNTKRKSSQKIGKILLAGGIPFSFGELSFVAIEFPKAIDGVYAIVSEKEMEIATAANALHGRHLQSRSLGFGLKGTIATPETNILKNVLGNYNAVIDIKELNSTYNLNYKLGNTVELTDLIILSTDMDSNIRDSKVNMQALSRAGISQTKLLYHFMDNIDEKDPLKIIPSFGISKMFNSIGHIVQWDDTQNGYQKMVSLIQSNLEYWKLNTLRKGITVPGGYLYNLPSNVPFDGALLSNEFMIKHNLTIGDYITVLIAPALFPDREGKSPFVFSKRIVGKLKSRSISISMKSNEYGLRDYDGDKLIVLSGRHALDQGVCNFDSLKVGTPAELELQYDSISAAQVFCNANSLVGVADDTAGSMYLYGLNDTEYLGACIQAPVYSMKHTIRKGYELEDLLKYGKEAIPKAFNGKGKLIKHPDLICRKESDTFNEAFKMQSKVSSYLADILELLNDVTIDKFNVIEFKDMMLLCDTYLNEVEDDVLDDLKDLSNQIWSMAFSKLPDDDNETDFNIVTSVIGGIRARITQEFGPEFLRQLVALMIATNKTGKIYYPLLLGQDVLRKVIDGKVAKHIDYSVGMANEVINNGELITVDIWRSRVNKDDVKEVSCSTVEFEVDDVVYVVDGLLRPINMVPANINCTLQDGEYRIVASRPRWNKTGEVIGTGITLTLRRV